MQDLREIATQEHNKLRKKHGAPDIKGDATLHQEAQQYAEQMAKTNTFKSTTLGKYGNNIGTSFEQEKEAAIIDVIKFWYNPSTPGSFKTIINETSTHFGIGIAWSDFEKQWIICAFYNPPIGRTEPL